MPWGNDQQGIYIQLILNQTKDFEIVLDIFFFCPSKLAPHSAIFLGF
jgi:hypothetical protein